MQTGAITGYIDVAQVTLYVFWAFFAGLIFWLRREDKREGYPLEKRTAPAWCMVQGFPPMPRPKTFLVRDGHTYTAPPGNIDNRTVTASPNPGPGSPLRPAGNPMLAGIGPSSWVEREDRPRPDGRGRGSRWCRCARRPYWSTGAERPRPARHGGGRRRRHWWPDA
jgi:photosynthetic reaction center H subunit